MEKLKLKFMIFVVEALCDLLHNKSLATPPNPYGEKVNWHVSKPIYINHELINKGEQFIEELKLKEEEL